MSMKRPEALDWPTVLLVGLVLCQSYVLMSTAARPSAVLVPSVAAQGDATPTMPSGAPTYVFTPESGWPTPSNDEWLTPASSSGATPAVTPVGGW
jgi:hypothetical protein